MATVREYFDTDPRALTVHNEWGFGSVDKKLGEITAKIAYDFTANAKYWYFFIPAELPPAACISALLGKPETFKCCLAPEGDGVSVEMRMGDYDDVQSTDTLVFTNRVHLYVDSSLEDAERSALRKSAAAKGLDMTIRDRGYAETRSAHEKPLAFISHDSKDKDDLVRQLAHEMIKVMCPVWYDEYSLTVGDSLRESIEAGLKNAQKCILVLSPNFLANGGWGKAEFDSIFTREILEQENVILPVWHNVSVEEVYEYSPRMADKVGLPSSLGPEVLAKKLAGAIRG